MAEYKKRHDEIWPDVSRTIRDAGFGTLHLPRWETLTLFAVQKQTDNNTAADLPNHPIVKKWWWAYMARR